MAFNGRVRTIRRVTGAARSTAPHVRRLATDDELRADMSEFVRSANDLVRDVATDARVRRDVRDMLRSIRGGAGRVRQDIRPRPRRSRALLVFGAGLILTGFAIGAALAYPRSRRGIVRVAGETRQRASSTVHDARERFGRPAGDAERRAV